MKANVQDKDSRLDLGSRGRGRRDHVAAIWGNLAFSSQPQFYRWIALFLAAAAGVAVASLTSQGAAFLAPGKGGAQRDPQVVGPRAETTQTTLIVVVVVVVMALILWGSTPSSDGSLQC
jgi:preprotein translocase subunit SecE